MKDIAFHITDIAENGIRAGAGRIGITLELDCGAPDRLCLTIEDNGCGMSPETLQRAIDPFYTTRTTRKVGLGLPFLFQNAAQCGGHVDVESTPGVGTCVKAYFPTGNIDCPPAGDLAGTLMQLLAGNTEIEICVTLRCGAKCEQISTGDLLAALDGLPAGHPEVALMIKQMLQSLLADVFDNRLN